MHFFFPLLAYLYNAASVHAPNVALREMAQITLIIGSSSHTRTSDSAVRGRIIETRDTCTAVRPWFVKEPAPYIATSRRKIDICKPTGGVRRRCSLQVTGDP